MSQSYDVRGTGRRKAAICNALLSPGTGEITVNRLPYADYLQHRQVLMDRVKAPLTHLQSDHRFDVSLHVSGGGLVGQADAMLLAISRALVCADPSYRNPLRRAGYLTQDSRSKERKKIGLKKARKSPQFSKR